MRNPGRIFSKEQISDSLDGEDWVDANSIVVHISHLRTKLEENEENTYIKNIKGLGYRFEK